MGSGESINSFLSGLLLPGSQHLCHSWSPRLCSFPHTVCRIFRGLLDLSGVPSPYKNPGLLSNHGKWGPTCDPCLPHRPHQPLLFHLAPCTDVWIVSRFSNMTHLLQLSWFPSVPYSHHLSTLFTVSHCAKHRTWPTVATQMFDWMNTWVNEWIKVHLSFHLSLEIFPDPPWVFHSLPFFPFSSSSPYQFFLLP